MAGAMHGSLAKICGAGSDEILALLARAYAGPGDEILFGEHAFVMYPIFALSVGATPIKAPETKFTVSVDALLSKVTEHTRIVYVANPNNPTGTMLSKKMLGDLVSSCRQCGATFISDEIYHGIEYENKAVTALEITDDCYVINSFSKYFSMTGWRIGWMVVPEGHIRRVERLAQNMFICAPHVSQIAAIMAMDCEEELQENLSVYRTNRDIMVAGLAKAGFNKMAPPDGAFYIYADVSHITQNSVTFAREILDEVGVAVTPGTDFDMVRGNRTLRFSYARSTTDIVEGIERLKNFMFGKGYAI